jgi:phage gp46-like protein
MTDFEGDLLLLDSSDGGDIAVENGLFAADGRFATAVYLSLFGGNKDDPGKVASKNEWWGNKTGGITENEKLRSRFQHIIAGLPMSVKNIKEAEKAAVMDLEWLIKEGIADAINVYGRSLGKNTFTVSVEILKDKSNVFANQYSLFWGCENGDIL